MIIYNISINKDLVNNPEIRDKIKLLAYLVYSEILDYEEESNKRVLYKENIVFNELYDGFRDRINKFEFEHEDYYTGYYEPFMIDDNTFGFTIYDNAISDKELLLLVNEVKNIIQLDCDINLEKIVVANSKERSNIINSFYYKNNVKKKERKK